MTSLLRQFSVAILILTISWVAINFVDESPDASLPAVPSDSAYLENPENNGFFALIGLNGPDGSSAAERHAAGLERYKIELSRNGAATRQSGETSQRHLASADGFRDDSLCDWSKGPCLMQLSSGQGKETVKQTLGKHRVLYVRYKELHAYPSLLAPMPDDVVFLMQPSPFDSIKQGNALLRATAGLAALEGRGEEAIMLLAEDIRFARRQLAATVSVEQLSMAALVMGRDLSLLDEILSHDPALRTKLQSAVAEAIRALDQDERNLERALRGHFLGLVHLVDTYARSDDWKLNALLSRPLFRRNAHINAEWTHWQQLISLLTKMPPDAINGAYDDWLQKNTFRASGIWNAVRNPTSAYFGLVSQPASPKFALPLTDLDAYQRMLAIKYGALPPEAPAPSQGFLSKPIIRSGTKLSVAQTPGSQWPSRLAEVTLASLQN
ncbi:MAG: hypothetical protein K9J42_07900 [Sulfuritalea sp.]|nr:hypothetical protein [Sulfuritalea sp.]